MGYTTEFYGPGFDVTGDDENLDAFANVMDALYETRHGNDYQQDPAFPSFYCQWDFDRESCNIQWDGGEKFYGYVEWLKIICNYAKDFDLVVNGIIDYQGEEHSDRGTIEVKDNTITVEGDSSRRR